MASSHDDDHEHHHEHGSELSETQLRVRALETVVCTENLNTGVLVMKSAQDGA